MGIKISQLPESTVLNGDEIFVVVSSGINKKVSANTLKTLVSSISKSDVGLGNVDNTSDLDKPISLATQQALDLKSNINHTHSLEDFPGLSSIIEDKANKVHSHAINEINGLQDTLDDKAHIYHTHNLNEITELVTSLENKADKVHSHQVSDISDFGDAVNSIFDNRIGTASIDVSKITGLSVLLDSKANVEHNHEIVSITGLQEALDGKSSLDHTHAVGTIEGLQEIIDGKADVNHTHGIETISGLNEALAEKANVNHVHNLANLPEVNAAINSKADVTFVNNALSNKADVNHTHGTSDIEGFDTAINNLRGLIDLKPNQSDLNSLQISVDNLTEALSGKVESSYVEEAIDAFNTLFNGLKSRVGTNEDEIDLLKGRVTEIEENGSDSEGLATLTTTVNSLQTTVNSQGETIVQLQTSVNDINTAIESLGGEGGSITTINQIVGLQTALDKKAEYSITEW